MSRAVGRFRPALLFLGVLAVSAPAEADSIEQGHMRLSIGSFVVGYLPLPLADALGFFRDEGITAEIENFGVGGSKSLQALIGGSTDAVVGGYDHTIQMQAQGKSIQCVIELNRTPGFAFAVRTEFAGEIRTLRDLKGRTLGISAAGSSTDFMVQKLLADAGLSTSDVRIIPVGSGQNAVAAVENRTVDAQVHFDPAITVLERRGLAKVFYDLRTVEQTRAAFGGEYPFTCLYATTDFIGRKPVTVQRLVNAFARTLAWIDAHSPAEIADATPPEYQLGGRDVFVQVMEASKPMFPADGHLNPADLVRAQQVIAKHLPQPRGPDFRLESTYTNRFVDAVPAGATDARTSSR